MKLINFAEQDSIINQFVSELRNIDVQKDRLRFRHNLERVGQMMAFEVSKTLHYSMKKIQTPLALADVNILDEKIVLGTIFRAGLPFHQGFLDVFDDAENAFVSAYRYYKDKECKDVGIKIEYIASPSLIDKTLIIADPMLATGGSMELGYQAFCTKGVPSKIHLCCILASQKGVDYVQDVFKDIDQVTLWCGAIDPDLNEHAYIVPGLGDAGDLAYGTKI